MRIYTRVSPRRGMAVLFAVSFLLCGRAMAQQSDPAVVSVQQNKTDHTPVMITFRDNANLREDQAKQLFTRFLGIDGIDNVMVQDYSTTTKTGVTATRFHQYYKGIKADFASYSMTSRNGMVRFMTGNCYDFSATPSPVPAITAQDAFAMALHHIDAVKYMWQDPGEEQRIKARYHNPDTSYLPKGHLVWVEDYRTGTGKSDRKTHLAWSFDIYASSPLSRQIIYVDAQTGKILLSNDMIKHTAATGHSSYSGVVPFITSNTGSTYVLYDSTRGNGIHTLNMNNGTSYFGSTEYDSPSDFWPMATPDTIALDAHWGAEVVYDFWKNIMGRLSYDNADALLLQYVHYDAGYNNAFWNGSEMTYGDGTGCGSGFTSLVSLDVTGHEIGHGVCQYTANLIYESESGAMNEGFSDCWGTSIENWANPFEVDAVAKSTWGIGEEIACGNPMRRMDQPKLKGQPDTYGGINWFDVTACIPAGGNDQCGVHNNSGVFNKWYYLVVSGGTGTNDIGSVYNVTGIGFAEARNILYQTELVLSSTADFDLMRLTSISTTAAIYGACSPEVVTVTNAWYAVGVGAAYVAFPAAISGSVNICVGGTVALTDASPGGTWTSGAPGVATVGSSSGIVDGVSAGTANITYSAGTGCNAVKVATINAFPAAAMSPSPSGVLCTGGSLLLSAGTGAGYTYQWKLAGVSIPGATSSTYTAGISGNYTIQVTNAAGCSSTSGTTVVTAVAPPLAVVTPVTATTFCAGGSAVLNANSGTGYTYQWLAGGTPLPGATSLSYTALSGGIYSVIVTNGAGCSATSGVTLINVTPLPTATASAAGVTTFCTPGAVMLNANTGTGISYQWQNGGTSISGATASAYSATTSGDYTVVVTQSGCSATSAPITVMAEALTVAPITGSASVCQGQNITVADATAGGIWLSGAPGTGTATVSGAGVVTGISAGTATISYAYTNTCGSITAIKTITVNALPFVAPVTGTTSVCQGATTPLADATAGGVWSSVTPATTAVGTTGVVTGIAAGAGSVSYTVTNSFGCMAASVAAIAVNPLPSLVLAPAGPVAICPGGNIVLTSVAGTGNAYQWQVAGVPIAGATNASFTAIAGGSYATRIVNAFGCTALSTPVMVSVSAALLVTPGVHISANPGNILCIVPSPVSFSATDTNGGAAPVYQWFVNGAGAATGASFTYTPASGDVVRCRLISSDICASPDTASRSMDMVISPMQTPSVTITSDPASICAGHVVNFTANPVYGGAAPLYRWARNGINVATGPEYFYLPSSGDVLTVTMFSNFPCLLADSANSPAFAITTHASLPNTITISVSQSGITEGSVDTFVAVAPNAGSLPVYQWLRNGSAIAGATAAIYTTAALTNGDIISCRVTSSAACAAPAIATSAGIKIKVSPVGVQAVAGTAGRFTLSPNPNSGSFVIEGQLDAMAEGSINIIVTDVLGQEVHRSRAEVRNGLLNERITLDNTLANGIYLVSVTTGSDRVVFHMVLGK